MANRNIATTGAIDTSPESANWAVFNPKPAARQAVTGNRKRAISGDTRRLAIATIMPRIVIRPQMASMLSDRWCSPFANSASIESCVSICTLHKSEAYNLDFR